MPRISITDEKIATDLGDCGITHDPYEIGDTVIQLECNHSFKEDSIVHWLSIGNTCPTCRRIVSISSK